MKLHEIKQQIDEGFVQDVFNYLWNATGKVLDNMPVVGDRREKARVKQQYDDFVSRMDEATTEKWISELTSNIMSQHPATGRAVEHRTALLRKIVELVKNSNSENRFLVNMQKLRSAMRDLDKFIQSSNKRVQQRRRSSRETA